MFACNPHIFDPPPDLLAITNPGAETGDLTGWTSLVGAPAAVSTTTAVAAPDANSGTYFFHGGSSSRAVLRQNVAIPSGWNTAIDAHGVYLNFRYKNINANGDLSMVTVDFVNGSGIIIGTYAPPTGTAPNYAQGTAWDRKSFVRKIPAGTRSINIDLNSYRISGTPCDGNFDDIEAWLSQGLQWPIELPISNPSGDVGAITGWTTQTGNPQTTATSGSGALPLLGRNYFYPGTTASSVMYQDISIPSAAHAAIDAGLVTLERDWYVCAPADADTFQLSVLPRDGSNVAIGSGQNAPASSDGSAPFGWVFKTIDFVLPALTRSIRLSANGARAAGTSNDGYSCAYSARLRL